MINWNLRLKSKAFWIALVPALLVLIQVIAALFGFKLELDVLQAQLLDVVNAVFILVAILGIAVDPTTPGLKDSELSLAKRQPSAFTMEEASKFLLSK